MDGDLILAVVLVVLFVVLGVGLLLVWRELGRQERRRHDGDPGRGRRAAGSNGEATSSGVETAHGSGNEETGNP